MQSLVSEKYETITATIQSMANCEIKQEIFEEKLRLIQDIINDFIGRKVTNLHIWVPELNVQLENIFAARLETLIQEWIKEFINFKEFEDQEDGSGEGLKHI